MLVRMERKFHFVNIPVTAQRKFRVREQGKNIDDTKFFCNNCTLLVHQRAFHRLFCIDSLVKVILSVLENQSTVSRRKRIY